MKTILTAKARPPVMIPARIPAQIPALTLVLMLGMLSCGPAFAQQTGGPPMPLVPRTVAGPTVPSVLAPVVAPTTTGETDTMESKDASTVPLSAAAIAVLAPPTVRPAPTRNAQTSLLIEVESERAETAISVAIYRDADSFRKGDAPVRTLTLNREGPVVRAFVLNLPAGRYAITAWQDVDGDGKPGRNRFGGATEPVAYSRGARARFGVPSFEDAAFDIAPGGVTERLSLRGR